MPRILITATLALVALTACGGDEKPTKLDAKTYTDAGIDYTTIGFWYGLDEDGRQFECRLYRDAGGPAYRKHQIEVNTNAGSDDPEGEAFAWIELLTMSCPR